MTCSSKYYIFERIYTQICDKQRSVIKIFLRFLVDDLHLLPDFLIYVLYKLSTDTCMHIIESTAVFMYVFINFRC